MILLLGGTTEGKEVARWLDEAGQPYLYSTKTKIPFEGKGSYRHGALDREGLQKLCGAQQLKWVINASHPFAAELHETAASLAPEVKLIRFERLFPERMQHPLVHYVEDYSEAIKILEDQEIESLLVLSGVQSIPKLKSFWERKTSWFRILDRQESLDFARQHAFPAQNLLLGYPQDKEEEIALFQKLKPGAILTKESGFNGMLPDKIAAAHSCKLPIVIIKKPCISPVYKVVNSREELFKIISH